MRMCHFNQLAALAMVCFFQISTSAQSDSLKRLISAHLAPSASADTSRHPESFASTDGMVTVHSSPRIDSLEKRMRDQQVIQGFRIQIFLGSYQEARNVRARFNASHADIPSYQVQNLPDHTVRVGDYRNLVEAYRQLRELKKEYPAAFILRDSIEPPRIQ